MASFNFSCDGMLNGIVRFFSRKGYIGNLKKNLEDLEREMYALKAIKDEVMSKFGEHRFSGEGIPPTVRIWLTRVQNVDSRYDGLAREAWSQLENLCLCGLCSKNVWSSYKYGKSVFLMLEEVEKLKSEGGFKEVAELPLVPEILERSTRRTVGQEEMLKTAWKRLMEDGVGIMGLHGMGGVGKTTLLKKIHDKFTRYSVIVIWVVVSQGSNISQLQQEIAQRLHLCGDEWTKINENDKAATIHKVLKRKGFVLILDDIWEKVDLEAIGVPEPTRENRCKIAFTTRSKEVCLRMGDHEPMHIKCLEKDKAWELLKSKIGENILRREPLIVELAKKVADKCQGLPLALNVIGETMASTTMTQDWEEAIETLTSNAAEFPEMEDKILPVLKYSYDNLADDKVRLCFLYCALFPEDGRIDKERLVEYWICEGFIGEYQVLKRAISKGYGVLGTLIHANLLIEVDRKTVVMHNLVREMALWIASDFGGNKENFVVQAKVGLRQVSKVKDWGAVRRMSLISNKIEEMNCGSKCSQLTTLLLQDNYNLRILSGEAIQYMQKLVVLDLSGNHSIKELPEQISELTSLQYLDLSGTRIEKLPVGFQELKKLTHLNLTSTYILCSISGISKLSRLRSLKLLHSNVHGDDSLVKELQHLEHLQFLTIRISTVLGLEQILGDQRMVNCIYGLHISDFQISKPFSLSLLVSMENLRELRVTSIHVSDTKCSGSETDSSDLHNLYSYNPTSPCFNKLSTVRIVNCNSFKDLTLLLFAPNLVSLHISNSEEVEEIINKEKASKLTGLSPFEKLEELYLETLPKLESIYWSPLPFPFLRRVEIINCPELRKIPFNATSASRIEKLSISVPFLEWEDDATIERFLPLILED